MTTHPASLSDSDLLARCAMRTTRRSGPGGQHRNKVESAVVLTDGPTGLSAEANERRSQAENRERALFRLRLNLALAFRTTREPGSSPSETWQSRCRNGRIAVNATHRDFPVVLAEALDAIEAEQGDVRAAGEWLGCTASQLVKLIKQESRGLRLLNELRAKHALPPLR